MSDLETSLKPWLTRQQVETIFEAYFSWYKSSSVRLKKITHTKTKNKKTLTSFDDGKANQGGGGQIVGRGEISVGFKEVAFSYPGCVGVK